MSNYKETPSKPVKNRTNKSKNSPVKKRDKQNKNEIFFFETLVLAFDPRRIMFFLEKTVSGCRTEARKGSGDRGKTERTFDKSMPEDLQDVGLYFVIVRRDSLEATPEKKPEPTLIIIIISRPSTNENRIGGGGGGGGGQTGAAARQPRRELFICNGFADDDDDDEGWFRLVFQGDLYLLTK